MSHAFTVFTLVLPVFALHSFSGFGAEYLITIRSGEITKPLCIKVKSVLISLISSTIWQTSVVTCIP